MSENQESAELSTQEKSALFMHFVQMHTQQSLMFLGQIPNPATGEHELDLEAGRMFIDYLEVLEEKTKGNLSPEEARLLRECVSNLQMAFVEIINHLQKEAGKEESGDPKEKASDKEPSKVVAPSSDISEKESGESKVKFSKKY